MDLTFCENRLYIDCGSFAKLEYIDGILQKEENILFFESFIKPNEHETTKETYGTDYDVYIEYTEIDVDDLIISILLFTHETPCIEFCKRFGCKYSVDVQLVYYNPYSNVSGKFYIHNYQIILNETWNYHQGLYYTDKDRFWDFVKQHPNEGINTFWYVSPEDSQELMFHFMESFKF
jgi:hypothetical protein